MKEMYNDLNEITMELEGKIDEKGIIELSKATFPLKYRMLSHAVAICFSILAVTIFASYDSRDVIVSALIYIGGAAIVELFVYFKRREVIKINRDRWCETTNGKDLIYYYRLGENAVHIRNVITGAETEMPYDIFIKYMETAHYVLLFTKGKQYLAFDKVMATQKDLKSFVKSKNARLKIYRFSKFTI